jgi:hypothetical protein
MAEATDEVPISHLQRRRIESRVLIPFIAACREKFGEAGGGSLDIDMVAAGDDRLDFNVTRCRYAEFYKELGLADLGYLVHCNRDHAMIDGFNPDLKLTRTQTVMEGASHCDFRFTKKS